MTIYLSDYRTASTSYTEMLEDIDYPQRVHWFPDTYEKVKTSLVYAPHKLAEKVLDPALLFSLRSRPGKTAFILAAGNAHFAGINPKDPTANRFSYDYRFLALSLTQVYAGRIAQMCNAQDMVITDSSACASSLKVMMDVYNLINFYKFDRVVVLAVEDTVNNTVLKFFGESKASHTKDIEDTGIKPSAFDDHNYGFNIGQGAAFAVFENDSHCHLPAARLISAYSAGEQSTNAIGQREDGEGFVKAAAGALRMANLSPRDIDVVKTHGTGTKSNNLSERNALKVLFDSPFVATSFKQRIGHTMGASGLLETCLLLNSLKRGVVPGIPNRTNQDDVYLSNDHVVTKPVKILSQAAGMGNIYAAAIFDTKI